MNIFATLHKSIVSGRFYETVPAMPVRSVVKFFLLICLLTTLICGISHLWYAVHAPAGLAAETAEALGGIELKSGVLDPHRPVPYVPDNTHVSRAFELVFWLPQSSTMVPDSFVVVDTNANSLARIGNNTLFLLSSRRLVVNPGSPFSYGRSYAELFGTRHLIVDRNSIQNLLVAQLPLLALFYCAWTAIADTAVYFMSVVCIAFVALAAYIFSVNRPRSPGEFLKMAFFAASPLYIGTNIVAVSGTGIAWTWHVFILVSTVVMLRGVMHASRAENHPDL